MGQGTIKARPVLREALLALLVLAMAFLNFGHVTPSLANGTQVTADWSFCGDPALPGGGDHAPCHACRIGGGADLPPAPSLAEPIAFAITPVVYAEDLVTVFLPSFGLVARPRGPPAV